MTTEFLYVDNKHSTGASSVKIDKEGKPSYLIKEGVALGLYPNLNTFI